jgi:NO-binding membrane sensor protein with MHYT domain
MTSTDIVIVTTHDHRLVALFVVVSILAADAALALTERIREARGRTWLAGLVGGATVDGK